MLTALLLLASCGPPFPKELLAQVDRAVVFPDLQKEPDRYRGRLLLLGGVIVETKNLRDGTQIEVLQRPLDGRGRPEQTDATGGRFLILTDRFHDAAVFHRGREVTVVGEAAGLRTQPLGEVEYRYPLVRSRELHLWSPYAGPRFSIGVGVFRSY